MPGATSYPVVLLAASDDAGRRLDLFLVSRLEGASRARVQQLIRQEKVLVADAAGKAAQKLRHGDKVTVLAPPQAEPLKAEAEDIPLDVVFEDDAVAVINKPAGMVVHAGAGGAGRKGTLVNALLHRYRSLSRAGGELRPGIVHRLDRQTSGLLVIAKTDAAHRSLAAQFAGRTVQKKYLALVEGWMPAASGSIQHAIRRDRVRRTRMTTRGPGGREALSHYRVLEKISSPYGRFSLLEVRIATGRTHQIRVHLASLGHPVVGDALYGAARVLRLQGPRASKKKELQPPSLGGRNFLHAAELEFVHPVSGDRMEFSQPLPPELESFLAALKSAR